MHKDIKAYNTKLTKTEKDVCNLLAEEISKNLPDAENKIWHAHPVWFLDGNPITGYSSQKEGIRLMFWSGADFGDKKLIPGTGKFKDASVFYKNVKEVNLTDLKKWLKKSKDIQWDYKNIVKRKGVLVKLEPKAKKVSSASELKDGDFCKVTGGTHAGKSGIVRDINLSKTGHITITVVQKSGVRFKTLGKNVVVEKKTK